MTDIFSMFIIVFRKRKMSVRNFNFKIWYEMWVELAKPAVLQYFVLKCNEGLWSLIFSETKPISYSDFIILSRADMVVLIPKKWLSKGKTVSVSLRLVLTNLLFFQSNRFDDEFESEEDYATYLRTL